MLACEVTLENYMTRKMLIDASHPEETRVVIVNGTRIEELDFESANKRQLRGNLYLARVTRVEPSLQAAFVEYGGNRHGFLAFSEIHPDYYQIPYEDRMALIEAEEAENLAEEAEEEAEAEKAEAKAKAKKKTRSRKRTKAVKADDEAVLTEDDEEAVSEDTEAQNNESDDAEDDEKDETEASSDDADNDNESNDDEDEDVSDEQEKTASNRRKRTQRRRYKIQEVIKRGQILLIQVVKEERGNKGAAMTTYLSLAGRYCVLMPNTPRGGGISRKIANGTDRKRLKSIVSEMEVPSGMGVIVRTAGAKRTKLEIKRDYDYLCRLWETIRNTTLKSIAPALIHEEGNLVKRSIRDLYNKDVKEILVQGDEAYKTAKSFIKMLMPSHAKNVKAYKDPIPLFLRYQVERQIEDSLDSVVQLKSGGYLVIHPTEALVSIDINSGRSTRERNVERTALKTNLEAADEIARQMRLRDLAGLIVIDFIDMEENRNNRAVEKRMKEALSQDRARVQASRISQFGLMEISRQRRRRSLLEGSTVSCPHCQGVGRQRTIESAALHVIRAAEETAARGKAKRIAVKVAPEVATYLFNEKRADLAAIETEFGLFTAIEPVETLVRPNFELSVVEKSGSKTKDPLAEIEEQNAKDAKKAENKSKSSRKKAKKDEDPSEGDETDVTDVQDDEPKKRKRRRGRRGGRGRKSDAVTEATETGSAEEVSSEETVKAEPEEQSEEKPKPKRRSTTRRKAPAKAEKPEISKDETPADAEEKPKAKSTRRRKAPTKAPAKKAESKKADDKKAKPIEKATSDAEEPVKKTAPKRSTTRRKAPTKDETAEPVKKTAKPRKTAKKVKQPVEEVSDAESSSENGDSKRGWWQRRRKK